MEDMIPTNLQINKKPIRERPKMKPEYEDIIRYVCGDNWMNTDLDERDGAYGVAMTLAYMKGVPSRLGELSAEIGVPPYVLEMAFRRLQVNGIFCQRSPVFTDPILRNEHDGSEYEQRRTLLAWCYIAGLSSGYTGKGFSRAEYAQQDAKANKEA